MRLFDRYVAVDWSGSATPTTGRDSIWFADLAADDLAADGGGAPDDVRLRNPSTRAAASDLLAGILAGAGDERVLVGIDAGLGYPAGSAELFGLDGIPWRSTWSEVSRRSCDDERNRNNRFEVAAALNGRAGSGAGPFWGCPSDEFGDALRRTKPSAFPVGEYRRVERRLKASGRHPKSCWQLLGAGSVGGQTLTALPVLDRLLSRSPGRLEVWPFTTGLRPPTAAAGGRGGMTVAEVWPNVFDVETPAGRVPDAAQVEATAIALRDADRTGTLADWFAPDVDAVDVVAVETEEGWILGPPETMGCTR